MGNSKKAHWKNLETWKRFPYMLLFAVIYGIMDVVIAIAVIFQVISMLFTGSQNQKVRSFGGELGRYACQILHYLTYYTETKPFPFSDWPSEKIKGNE